MNWISIEEKTLPERIEVLCFNSKSKEIWLDTFIEPHFFEGIPTHWMEIELPKK